MAWHEDPREDLESGRERTHKSFKTCVIVDLSMPVKLSSSFLSTHHTLRHIHSLSDEISKVFSYVLYISSKVRSLHVCSCCLAMEVLSRYPCHQIKASDSKTFQVLFHALISWKTQFPQSGGCVKLLWYYSSYISNFSTFLPPQKIVKGYPNSPIHDECQIQPAMRTSSSTQFTMVPHNMCVSFRYLSFIVTLDVSWFILIHS